MTANSKVPNEDSVSGQEAPTGVPLIQVIWQRKGLVLLGLVAGVILAGLYYAQAAPVYESKAQVLVVKKRPDAVTGVDTRQLSVEDYVSTHQVLIKSPLIIERAIKKRGLSALKSFTDEKDDLAEAIGKALIVTRNKGPSGNNNILDVAYRTKDAAEAALVLEAVIESYKDFLDETYKIQSDDTLDLITKARDLLQKNLAQKYADWQEFRLKAPILGKSKEGTNLWEKELIDIKAKRAAVLLRRAEVQGHLEAIEKARAEKLKPEDLQALMSDLSGRLNQDNHRQLPTATLQDQLLPILQEEQKLLERYGANHPEVQSVRKRIEVARNLFSSPSAPWQKPSADPSQNAERPVSAVEGHVQYLRQQLNHLDGLEKRLAKLFDEEHSDVRKVIVYETQDEGFRTEIARTEQLCDGIIKRLQDVSLVKDVGGYDAKTIASPALGKKVSPKIVLVLPIGAFLGILLGFGMAYLAEVTDKSFRTPEEIRRRLGLPVVGYIPLLKPDNGAIRQAAEGGVVLDPMLCSFHRPKSMEAEAYRGVRTALYFHSQGGGNQVIQVTSPNPGDGKSSTAANLAVTIAQSGKKVLLMDADLRKPRIHKIFGLSVKVGLSSIISGEAEPLDAIQESCVAGLSILPCGPIPSNPSELLTAPRFEELLKLLREQYDFVIVDTPPLLAVTDPSVVASRVDGVILTIRITKDGRPAAERAKEILGTLGATVVGVVVNGVDGSAKGGYGYGNYGYGTGQGYHDDAVPQPQEEPAIE